MSEIQGKKTSSIELNIFVKSNVYQINYQLEKIKCKSISSI